MCATPRGDTSSRRGSGRPDSGNSGGPIVCQPVTTSAPPLAEIRESRLCWLTVQGSYPRLSSSANPCKHVDVPFGWER